MLKSLHCLSVLSLVIFMGCSTPTIQSKNPRAISIMSYNVENLFDTQHDEGKEDYTFLPLSVKQKDPKIRSECMKANTDYRKEECLTLDWNEEALDMKMKRLADAILSVNGEGPDILLLQEVENIRILQRFNSHYLKKANYQTAVLIEGEDERGIDLALLSRLPLAGTAKLHPMEIRQGMQDPRWKRPLTRGILETPLKLPTGETLYVMGFHFPSQGSPLGHRQDAIQFLNKLIDKKGPKALIVAGGDSNVSAPEEAQHKLQKEQLGSKWRISHFLGCQKCEGTYNYRGTWNWFDILLFSPNLTNGKASYQVLPQSIRIPTEGKYQLRTDGSPARFDRTGSVGVTDHLPIYAEIAPK